MSMEIYKPGQGKYTRLGTGFSVAVVVAIGCWRLSERLSATDLGQVITYIVPAVVLVAVCAVMYWLLNKPYVADFMIAAEGELKKVNWSSRKEIAVSTTVVIIVVVAMAILLGATDMVLQMIVNRLLPVTV